MFTLDVKANKHQITQAVKKLQDTDVDKVSNALIRPDGQKKTTLLWLPSDYDAQNVDHLNRQLANLKYTFSHSKNKKKRRKGLERWLKSTF